VNTLKIEAKLAQEYKYKPLPSQLSEKYREFFTQNIPAFLKIDGNSITLYTIEGSILCNGYNRIVVGDYGAFIEFNGPAHDANVIVQAGQEYRIDDPKYKNNVKYHWYTIEDGSNIKLYYQKRTVSYADYIPKKWYVSVHEVNYEQ
jgi:hypothetical protein